MNYLAFYVDSFDIESPSEFWILDDNSENIQKIEPKKLSTVEGPIVTIDPLKLVQFFSRLKISLPVEIVDLSLIQKIHTGRPKSDFSEPLPWDFRVYLDKYLEEESLAKVVDFSMSTREPEEETLLETLQATTIAIKEHFKYLLSLTEGAYSYFKFEVQIANIFYRTQYRGIKINREIANSKLLDLEDEYYTKLQELRDMNNFKGGVFDASYIAEYLIENSSYYVNVQHLYSIDAFINGFYKVDPLADKLRTLRKIWLTLSALLKVVGDKQKRIFPYFDSVGTVTGRIQAIEPLLQHVRKIDRDFIIADDGFELLYLDYKEFEPRIVAALSKDPVLLDLIKEDSLYEGLSSKLLQGLVNRNQAKVIMMQLLYFASIESITNYVSMISGKEEGVVLPVIEELISSLGTLREWQALIIKEIESTRTIKLPRKLPRYFKKNITFTNKMKRQAINHIVQGTGAFIFKNALHKIVESGSSAELLLPMHDAILLQIPEKEMKNEQENIINILNNAFESELKHDIGIASKQNFSS